jgi:hypothetical protein
LLYPLGFAPVALLGEDQKHQAYHDKKHSDDHDWNDNEDRAYRMYAKENHHMYKDFHKLKENDQQAYWDWRHDHSDALLKIDIRYGLRAVPQQPQIVVIRCAQCRSINRIEDVQATFVDLAVLRGLEFGIICKACGVGMDPMSAYLGFIAGGSIRRWDARRSG